MATIKQIDGRTVHQIQSGQVIVDLCSVVKELVENSIDAGAGNVDVRFRNQGLDLIEVLDNGNGISPANYASVALKHHTSKLSSYTDIGSLETFGFRGEALASLCALSNVTVTTCLAADAPKGSKLTFESSGKLSGTSIVAAQKGTTVSVEKLFHNLPVRRRELERNIKREWNKVINLLNQYACIKTNTKFSVSQQPTKGKKILLFSTKGNPTTRENIINIFGAKTMAALVPLELTLEMRPSTISPALQPTVDTSSISKEVRIVGHVSRPAHGEGRQTPDRQMFFVNGRPCGLPQFSKAFNEVYKSYNATQSPFVFADIQLDTHMYDVNVSPDKRTILLHDQQHLLDSVRTSLANAFDSYEYSVPTAKPSSSKPGPLGPSILGRARQDSAQAAKSSVGHSSTQGSSSSDSEAPESEARHSSASSQKIVTTLLGCRNSGGRSSGLLQRWVRRESPAEDIHSKSKSHVGTSRRRQNFNKATEDPASSDSDSKSLSSSDEDDGDFEEDQASNEGLEVVASPSQSPGMSHKKTSSKPASGSGLSWVSPLPSKRNASALETTDIPSVKILKPTAPGDNLLTQKVVIRGEDDPAIVEIGTEAATHDRQKRRGSFAKSIDNLSDDSEVDGSEDSSEHQGPGGSSLLKRPAEVSDAGESDHTPKRQHIGAVSPSRNKPAVVSSPKPTDEHDSDVDVENAEDVSSEDELRSQQSRSESPQESDQAAAYQGVSPTADNIAKSRPKLLQTDSRRKDATLSLIQNAAIDLESLRDEMNPGNKGKHGDHSLPEKMEIDDISAADAESKLSLIISKSDFGKMRIIGQFNMGFILAVRPEAEQDLGDSSGDGDELFIIDQHASDEKYNFERLQETTVVQSQRLVNPKRLELTAVEEEVVMQNTKAIETNGFKVEMQTDGSWPVGSRCLLTALPLSRETTFGIPDLEELISLLGDESSETTHIPRPSKVRKMFAMRACRSSVMIGKALTRSQMCKLVGHMGELNKPWNCPHGRPTMRHICRMEAWDERSWAGDLASGSASLWATYTES